MINNKVLVSVFDSYNIDSVVLLEDNDTFNFIISNMSSSISLDRWEYLENILKDITKKNVNIISAVQASNYFDISKGLVIK